MQSSGILSTSITIGSAAGKSILIPAGSWQRVNDVMPGGSTPGPLTLAGQCNILDQCFTDNYLTNQGKINNVLLSQTITLALNVRLDGGKLGTFKLGNGCIQTSGGSFQINQDVINYLGSGATVNDLLQLANDVLGGVKTPGVAGVPSYSSINNAVDAINNGFDECRTFLNYCTPQRLTTSTGNRTEEKMEVLAYPNPYLNESFNLKINAPLSGQAIIQLYTVDGKKIGEVKRMVIKDVNEIVNLRVPGAHKSTIIYRVSIGSYTSNGIVLSPN